MNTTKKMIAANWKMNVDSSKDAEGLFLSIRNVVSRLDHVDMVVFPPAPYVEKLADQVSSDNYVVGCQDFYHEPLGSRTGHISVSMMKNAGAKYAILGHSERRHLETKLDVAKKVIASIEHEITPIICIGEEIHDKTWKKVLSQQLKDVFNRVPKKNLPQLYIAYEPIWAISTDKKNPATSVQYMEALEHIKKELTKILKSAKIVDSIKFLYGGSLDDKNIEDFLKNADVDGFLVGRVSHDPRILMTMFRLIEELVTQEE